MGATTVVLAVMLLSCGVVVPAEDAGPRELAPGLFLVNGLGEAGNVAFLVTPDGVLVVDSGESAANGQAILEQVRSRTPAPVRYLVLTHRHADHTFGAPAFPGTTAVVGQRGLREAMVKDLAWQREAYPPYIEKMRAEVERTRAAGDPGLAGEEARLARTLAAYEIVTTMRLRLPEIEVDGALDLRLGERTVEVRSATPSHTGDSSLVRIPALRAAHFGDLLFAGCHAYVDPRTDVGADTAHWIEALEEAKSWDLAVVIPGHGPVGGPELIDAQIAYLEALRREVAAAKAAGATLEQATERVGAAMRAAHPGYRFEDGLPDGIAAVWAELR